jgi:serine O-acetyltransferase
MNQEEAFIDRLFAAHREAAHRLPSPGRVAAWLDDMLALLFPEWAHERHAHPRAFRQHFEDNRLRLFELLAPLQEDFALDAAQMERDFYAQLPWVYERLLADAGAILQGDPAAGSRTEVIRTYPGFYAIAVYRLAHLFYHLKAPLIPRMLTEHAHAKTGIDIHPGAVIGERFCIDHGTGVVIGETVVIGNDVKIYQGVTLGALSVSKELAQTKRHPTIEDRVVIYAGATILGGETVIGHDSIIGGNTWIVKAAAPYSKIYYRNED